MAVTGETLAAPAVSLPDDVQLDPEADPEDTDPLIGWQVAKLAGIVLSYADGTKINEGDVIRKQNSQKTYTIGETETINGVYNINKGYAIFREITIIDENEEYCIVEAGSTFGLAQYDHIALNADTVNDEDIVIHY